jgi:hypothetical protein
VVVANPEQVYYSLATTVRIKSGGKNLEAPKDLFKNICVGKRESFNCNLSISY